jgi:hypothetical protein
VPGALKAAFAFVRSLTESIPSLIGLEREGAMKSRDFAESFAPTIAAYREACERRIGVFKSEPTFEHYADACNKIEELKFLISEAAALK